MAGKSIVTSLSDKNYKPAATIQFSGTGITMNHPRLVDLSGTASHLLTGRIVTIGSSKECHIRIDDKQVPSRAAHCVFTGGSYRLQRLSENSNVTVNGAPIKNAVLLKPGDSVKIGGKEFRFSVGDADYEASSIPPQKTERELTGELIAVVITLLRNRGEEVFPQLVASVSRLLKCDASRLVVENEDTGERTTIARYPRGSGLDRFSNRAIDWARDESATILIHDIDWKDADEEQVSLERNLVTSVLCAPLKEGTSIAGYLYCDRLKESERFSEEDRRFCDLLAPLFSEILSAHKERMTQRETISRLQQQGMEQSGGMIFESAAMGKVVELASRLAATESPLMITGETGTGKELMARFVHRHSRRADKAFKAINCGAIPENLIESELFGHEKGAFTGANARKPGLFEAAQDGTVFLDEIGELPLQLQVKLLRVLQESEITRLGGTETVRINVRIVAATNKNLEEEVRKGTFRQDLFFRLNVLTVTLPPLRDRDRDILLLADYCIKKYALQFGLQEKSLTSRARALLLSYSWPGNIRELENTMQKAILLSSTNRINPEDIQLGSQPTPGGAGEEIDMSLKAVRSKAEKDAIITILKKTSGNVSLASKMLEIDRKWLIKKMNELGIEAGGFRPPS
ncbi:MAG: GAF domain-containing protein [Chitinivibrionales bacterium]|nr:GAF domain-containing protein [Chitinivibrionales bacterium]